jgi:hypothetical protein
VAYDRNASFFFCQPEVLDTSTCWTCNSDYDVKARESVTTRSMRLRNKQRGNVFVSNGFASKNTFTILS